jgi:DNA-binding MarR family transcriptional regulator/N-acetylglutamate synthase-like GNAT family acetyltransferase
MSTISAPSSTNGQPGGDVVAVRAFNRFYTNVIGALQVGHLRTPHSLTEARVVFELAQRSTTPVAELRRTLNIDRGYLSRLLARFEADGLIRRERSSSDSRQQMITLTDAGRSLYELLDRRSSDEISTMLSALDVPSRRRLVVAMATIREIVEGRTAAPAYALRPPAPGDYGWVVAGHGALYAQEYGWDETFEALVARIVADYAERHDPEREAAWIADVDGEQAGCVFCVWKDDETAKLRLLLVEPWARGMGIGSRLVDECLRFARRAGYRRITLWTNDVLVEARRIYQRAGFVLESEERHHSYGHDLVAQDWGRDL